MCSTRTMVLILCLVMILDGSTRICVNVHTLLWPSPSGMCHGRTVHHRARSPLGGAIPPELSQGLVSELTASCSSSYDFTRRVGVDTGLRELGRGSSGDTIPNSRRGVVAGLVSHHGSIGTCDSPGMPHHVTQRGNRGQQTFFDEEDSRTASSFTSRFRRAEQVAIWAYCLMPNHVHLIVVPQFAESLHLAIGEAHRRYTRSINFREGWRGHLWQGRFASFVMEDLLLTVTRTWSSRPCAPDWSRHQA